MNKKKILEDIQSLIQDIDKWTGEYVSGSVLQNSNRIIIARRQLENLMVAACQELSFLYDYIKEKKNVDDAWTKADVANWFQDSIDETIPPVWTDEHIDELTENFYLIYKEGGSNEQD